MKSGTQKVLLSVPRPIVAGFGSWLCSGPLSSVPAGSVTHPVGFVGSSFGRSKPEKSSLASGLNSTSRVSSLARCTLAWPDLRAVSRGLMSLVVASASRRASCFAAGGNPVLRLASVWSGSTSWPGPGRLPPDLLVRRRGLALPRATLVK